MKKSLSFLRMCRIDCLLAVIFLLCSGSVPTALGASNPDEITYLHFNGTDAVPIIDQIKVYTHNTCSMPGILPLLYGGLNPASYRVAALADLIIESDPDIVCLQEMCDTSALRLKEKLHNRYANFYLNVGSPCLFLESGLFVATKYNVIKKPEFYRFDVEGMQKGVVRGFLLLEMDNCIVINTHLQPGDTEKDQEVRRLELGAVIEKIYELQTSEDTFDKPIVLCGDLNIVRTGHGDDEYSRSQIPEMFYDAYQIDGEFVTIDTETQTDIFSNPEDDSHHRVLDYILVPRQLEDSVNGIRRIEAYSRDQEFNISDHHALMATVN